VKGRVFNYKGFTLIELLIVVAIIGILAAIAVSSYSRYRNTSFNSAALADVRSARSQLELFYSDNLYYPPNP
jgi:prepilin-type N-terminal cleavage/methylation domain-containing protein